MAAADRAKRRNMLLSSVTLSSRLGRAGGVVLLLATVACTQLPSTASVATPPIPPGAARVWFYRQFDAHESMGTPYIRMNEAIVAVSEPGGASFRDLPAGPYHITVDSYGQDFNQAKDVQLARGQELYVKIVSLREWITGGGSGDGGGDNGFGRDTFYVWLIPPEVARGDVARSAFYGG
jgi:hypothetical protein